MEGREVRRIPWWVGGLAVLGGVALVVVLTLFFSGQLSAPGVAEEMEQAAATDEESAVTPAGIPRNRVPAPKPSASRPAQSATRRTRAPQSLPYAIAPAARALTLPAGTRLDVVLNHRLSTETSKVGDTFFAELARAVITESGGTIRQGSAVNGQIVDLERPGRVSGVAKMTLVLTGVSVDGESMVSIETNQLFLEGQSTKAEDVRDVGIGTGVGAVIGGILGGKKGAKTGAVVGGAAGAGSVVATRGEDLVLRPEQELHFVLARNATVNR